MVYTADILDLYTDPLWRRMNGTSYLAYQRRYIQKFINPQWDAAGPNFRDTNYVPPQGPVLTSVGCGMSGICDAGTSSCFSAP